MNTHELENLFDTLFPINRSLTGDGVRQTLRILQPYIPTLQTHEVPSGKQVFDWTIPPEYNVQQAYIITPDGEKICDFAVNNLHLMGYSQAFEGTMTLDALRPHLYSLPDQPTAIPYITSYYAPRWGFCMAQNQLDALTQGTYTVCIRTTHNPSGSLTYADALLHGTTSQEILISTYICHPSMASNELSGILVATQLYQLLAATAHRHYTYRFVFVPETIGAINYLHTHGAHLKQHLIAGYVATCVGNDAPFTYKRSKKTSIANHIAEHILQHQHPDFFTIKDFFPFGSDERQYCSPAFNLPVGALMRTMYGEYDEYHTSLDNKNFVSFEAMHRTARTYFDICQAHEINQNYKSLNPHCEPQLGKRNLYNNLSTKQQTAQTNQHIMWLLAYADGNTPLIEIAQKAQCNILNFQPTIALLQQNGLLE